MLVPPDNFGLVEPGIYRCSKLEADHFPFLATLQLKSLVLLDAAKPPRTLKTFLEENNVDLYNLGGLKITNHHHTGTGKDLASLEKSDSLTSIGVEKKDEIEVILLDPHKLKNDSWMLIEFNLIVGAFEILFNKTKHNLLLVDSSLTLVGILRKIQKWNFSSVVNEYRIYTGNSSKSNYSAENFLELVQTELVPYEAKREESERKREDSETPKPMPFKQLPMHRVSLDETNDEDDTASFDDFEDDLDDDLLSASPQIPANLLKLVEQRKIDEKASPSTLPDFRRGGARNNSVDILQAHQRRKSSVDSRYIRANNNRFRNPSFSASSLSPGCRSSFETNLQLFKLGKGKNIEERAEREHKYYKPHMNGVQVKGVEVIKLRLPAELKLPDWFIRGRNYWEQSSRGGEELKS